MKLQEELTLTVPTEMGTNNTGLATKVLADIQKVLACALVHSTEGRVTRESHRDQNNRLSASCWWNTLHFVASHQLHIQD